MLKETDVRTTEDAVLVVGGDYEAVLKRLEPVDVVWATSRSRLTDCDAGGITLGRA